MAPVSMQYILKRIFFFEHFQNLRGPTENSIMGGRWDPLIFENFQKIIFLLILSQKEQKFIWGGQLFPKNLILSRHPSLAIRLSVCALLFETEKWTGGWRDITKCIISLLH